MAGEPTPTPTPEPTSAPQPTPAPTPSPTPDPTPSPEPEPSLLNQKNEPAKPAAAPDEYSDFTLPEGFEANSEVMTQAKALFKELQLPQEGAQKLIDFYSSQVKEVAEAPMKAWQEMQKKWTDEIKNDPQIGGVKLDAVRANVGRAIDLLGPDLAAQFRQQMDFTGAGNNPAFVRALNLWASKLVEAGAVQAPKPAPSGQPGSRPASAAAAIYPNLPSAG